MIFSDINNKNIEILDTTLRDGAQAEGVAFSVLDKLRIASALHALSIDYIEACNPSANPKDAEFFEKASNMPFNKNLVAFTSTRRKDCAVQDDTGLNALLVANTATVCIFGKASSVQVESILGITKQENLEIIESSVKFLKESGKRVIFDAEHFFDGYKSDPQYALEAITVAHSADADIICLCDTKGGSFPHEIAEIIKIVKSALPNTLLGIHTHNDLGLATACTLEAVRCGAVHVQGTYLGFGERCGNAQLSAIIPALQLKLGYNLIPKEKLPLLTATANKIAEIANISLKKNEPFVGRSAFAHKAGMHADGIIKSVESFEHIDPQAVGNTRRILMSEMTGKAAVFSKIHSIAPQLTRNSEEIEKITEEIKRMEHLGYQYEAAEASFEMLVRRTLGHFENSFELISYKIMDEMPHESACSATATIKVKVNDTVQIAAAEGDGPVNALDKALREALSVFYRELETVKLIDYKVRVMEPKDATAAVVRVLISSTDGNKIWTTVGVSTDIIEASWFALVDSIEYKLRG